jgi:hypothetical protein
MHKAVLAARLPSRRHTSLLTPSTRYGSRSFNRGNTFTGGRSAEKSQTATQCGSSSAVAAGNVQRKRAAWSEPVRVPSPPNDAAAAASGWMTPRTAAGLRLRQIMACAADRHGGALLCVRISPTVGVSIAADIMALAAGRALSAPTWRKPYASLGETHAMP